MAAQAATPFLESPDSPFLSPKKIAQRLSLQISDLADSAHVHRSTFSAHPHSSKVQEFLRNILRVISAATDTFGSRETAIIWMMNDPIPAFRTKTAYNLVTEGRVDDVVEYLDSIASGFVG